MAEETKEGLGEIKEEKKSQETSENSETVKTTETSETAKESKELGESQESKESEKMSPDDLMAMWEEALKEAQTSETQKQESSKESQKETSPSQPAKLEELSPSKKTGVYPELEFILDIPLEVSAEIGRTKMFIRDLLKLNQGSVIELEKFAGEPVEIYVNGKLMAKGEVVVVNDKFGVRITEIISAQERVKKLGS
ncbi:MAG: Flagellar motor switch/type III secretory pathway protein FliN [Thermodesulfobacteria bacterium]|nr:flagellar motor switch protein FliN [Thermodesulfobacteriota bacterium]MCU4138273.1 Flagellar motor switch/type III secretory pathway protein FliN [Thermodesulfobacteriota bacterium]